MQEFEAIHKSAREAMSVVSRHPSSKKIFWSATDRHAHLRRLQRRYVWAKIPKYRFNDLRHTFGSYAAMSWVSPEVIAEAMGHTSTTVTKLYAQLHPEYKRKALAKLESFGAKLGQDDRNSLKSQGSSQS